VLHGAFGVNKVLADIFEVDPGYLRYVLLENQAIRSTARKPNTLIAIGILSRKSKLHGWLQERLTPLNICTKYMLIDLSETPLSYPVLLTLRQPTKSNDENMLVIG
jgi:hypothetical protein